MAVDHALVGAVGHVAAAQRVWRDQVLGDGPGGGHERGAAGGRRQLLVHLDHRVDGRFAGAVVPVQFQRAAPGHVPEPAQRQLAIGGVHRLAEPRHHAVDRVLHVGVLAQPLPQFLELAARQTLEPLLDEITGQVGHATVLDEQGLVLVNTVEQVDRAGDGGAMRGRHLAARVESGRDEIAVEGPALAEAARQLRQRAVLVAAAQQQLGAADRAGGQDHPRRGGAAGTALAALEAVEVHAVAAAFSRVGSGRQRFDLHHQVQRADLGALLLGHRQVVEIQRVLGLDLAADVAVAAVHAGALHHAVLVFERLAVAVGAGRCALGVEVGVEADGQRQLVEAVAPAQLLGAFLHQPVAGGELVVGDGGQIHHLRHAVVVGLERGVGQALRPLLVEDLGLGFDRDIGVDQRATAHASAGGHPHVGEGAQVGPAVAVLRLVLVPEPGVVGVARVGFGRPAPAALEHQHLHAGLGQPAGRDGAAETAADDDRVVVKRCHVLPSG